MKHSNVLRPLERLLVALGFCSPLLFAPALAQTATADSEPAVLAVAPSQDENGGKDAAADGAVFMLGTVHVTTQAEQSKARMVEGVVDKEEIDLFEKKDVATALSRMPGVLYQRASGGRYESNVLVRGYSTSWGVPIYIDGVPAYVPYDGAIDMGRFTTCDTATIEVAKGYSSVIYGPNTLGGAINIISRKPTKPLDGDVTLGITSGNGREACVNVGTLQGKWYAQVSGSWHEQQYVRTARNFTGTDAAGVFRDTNRQNYRTRDQKISMKLGYLPNDTDEYAITYVNQQGVKGPRKDDPGFKTTTWEWPNWDRETWSFVSYTRLGESSYIKPRLFHDSFDNGLYGWGGSTDTSRYDDYSWGASIEAGTEALQNHFFKALLFYKFDQHKSYDTYGRGFDKIADTDQKMEQKILSLALEDTYTINPNWQVQAGVSYSKRNTSFVALGSNLNGLLQQFPSTSSMVTPTIDTIDPQIALFWSPQQEHMYHISLAKKTKFPSMRQQFSNYAAGNTVSCTGSNCPPGGPFPLVSLQNPDLKPERAIHTEVGYTGRPAEGMYLEASLFYSRNKDKIGRSVRDFWTYPGFAVQQTINIEDDIENKGLELKLDYELSSTVLTGLSYTYIRSRNKNGNYHETDIPRYHGSVYADIRVNEWLRVIPAYEFYGRSYYDVEGLHENPGYGLAFLKFSLNHPRYRDFTFNFGVNNLFNKDYREFSEIYPTPGRFYYANLRMQF